MTRGRPRKTEPDFALDAAMRLFWKQGFFSTSMSDLAQTTGMAKPGLYANFGNKESIYAKALAKYQHQYGAPMIEHMLGATDPIEDVLHSYLSEIAAFVIDPDHPGGCFTINSFAECAHHSTALEDLGPALHRLRRAALETRFETAMAQGELLPDTDTSALATFYAGQILAIGLLGNSGSNAETLADLITGALRALPLAQRATH